MWCQINENISIFNPILSQIGSEILSEILLAKQYLREVNHYVMKCFQQILIVRLNMTMPCMPLPWLSGPWDLMKL